MRRFRGKSFRDLNVYSVYFHTVFRRDKYIFSAADYALLNETGVVRRQGYFYFGGFNAELFRVYYIIRIQSGALTEGFFTFLLKVVHFCVLKPAAPEHFPDFLHAYFELFRNFRLFM